MTEQTSEPAGSSQTSSSDSIIAAAKQAAASQASSLGTSPAPSPPPSASQTGDIDPGSPPVTSSASAPGSEVVSSAPVTSDLSLIFARLQNIEAALLDHFGPKVEALEEALQSLAARAETEASPALAKGLEELTAIVKSLGGAQFGHTGHDGGNVFHAWWKKIMGAQGATAPSVLAQGGGSVTNTSNAPASAPLANSGAPIPLGK